MPRQAPCSPEFWADPASLVRENGLTPAGVAEELGCSVESVRNGVRQSAIDAGGRVGVSSYERPDSPKGPARRREVFQFIQFIHWESD